MALKDKLTPTTKDDAPDEAPEVTRDAISHNLLGTAQHPRDPISHNAVGPVEPYVGDKHLDIGNIGDDELLLRRQLRALATEDLLILAGAVRGESASR